MGKQNTDMEKIKFSVLIPTFKDKYLKDCINSILCQTYLNFEIIIVNDASPYDIDSIIDKYDDNRIHYFKNDIGFGAEDVVNNWNRCLSYATGNYVICMGDDDMLLPNCLEIYNYHILSNPNIDIFHIRTEVINENGDLVNLQEARPTQESIYSLIWHKVNYKRIQYIGDFCFKNDALIKLGGFYYLPYACFSDDISIYMASLGKGIYNINDIGFRYRISSQTITNTQNLRKTIISVEKAVEIMKSYLSNPTNNIDDEKYRILALKRLPQFKQEMRIYCIQEDMKKAPLNSFRFWGNKYKQYGLTVRTFYRIVWNSVKYKL